MNPLKPDLMTAPERIGETCAILARGLVRLKARQSSKVSGDRGESPLAMSPDRRLHADQEQGA